MKYGLLGIVISGSILSLEFYSLDLLFSIKLLSQGEVSAASAAGLITCFPINIGFSISAAIFLISLLVLVSGLRKFKNKISVG